ncbi:hypothetical protein AU184_07275 [Mycolicibacterium novocastrense]|uniref:phage terminase small subunit n=1 Tax=Mycolicibacterium novocastrense TaxID=59813 RepID=UPI0007480C16|nr:hypothetical protein [Mycolicibacterium novocastrense]KUH73661.1 hypothetical protein AU183_25195 [Mycolicibacterium novocastrense]KUH74753.1 hypothetical protein AU072_12265 [Mycolicibacterium novocastrense]KUH76068.1 hypothetical protein AU184_07275 [Mycolicibacterium novocastrense]
MREKWEAWRTVRTLACGWSGSDWQYAMDTCEIAAAAMESDAKVGILTELRFREKTMGTTWNARRDMRIRYTTPVDAAMSDTVTRFEKLS